MIADSAFLFHFFSCQLLTRTQDAYVVKRLLNVNDANVLWNSLPLDIRHSLSLDVLESKLKNYNFDGRFTRGVNRSTDRRIW